MKKSFLGESYYIECNKEGLSKSELKHLDSKLKSFDEWKLTYHIPRPKYFILESVCKSLGITISKEHLVRINDGGNFIGYCKGVCISNDTKLFRSEDRSCFTDVVKQTFESLGFRIEVTNGVDPFEASNFNMAVWKTELCLVSTYLQSDEDNKF